MAVQPSDRSVVRQHDGDHPPADSAQHHQPRCGFGLHFQDGLCESPPLRVLPVALLRVPEDFFPLIDGLPCLNSSISSGSGSRRPPALISMLLCLSWSAPLARRPSVLEVGCACAYAVSLAAARTLSCSFAAANSALRRYLHTFHSLGMSLSTSSTMSYSGVAGPYFSVPSSGRGWKSPFRTSSSSMPNRRGTFPAASLISAARLVRSSWSHHTSHFPRQCLRAPACSHMAG